jgi:hypothetical protein
MTRTMKPQRAPDTAIREGQLSDLTRRIGSAREAAEHEATQREIMIRRYGLAHPRTIAASQRLVHAQQAQRRLTNQHRQSVSELGRMKAHDQVRLMVNHTAASDT